jgi:hypothetical protein
MRISLFVSVITVLALAAAAPALEKKQLEMRDDYAMEPLTDCALQYYYYIPCLTYSWFWNYTGWDAGDIVGAWFQIGDMPTGGYDPCDPQACHTLRTLRVLDFAGYCNYPRYPDLCTVELDIYCADEFGCPVGPSLWNSGHYWRMYFGWNYLHIDPPISICGCAIDPGPPPSGPRILIVATHGGTQVNYPAWGFDNISTPLGMGCAMHENGCLPALYPRPSTGHYTTVHSGYYGNGGFQYCPPLAFPDGRDTTADGSQYGYLELAWRLYLDCTGPSKTEPTTWSSIKSMYK